MGKKGRRTRWRTLTIADDHSDSDDESNTSSSRYTQSHQPKNYYGKYNTYSSQSTPVRRYQHDGTKSTRSSSTASENKITFNEDEYTRITTPRQDVLFKKGYLNKPKNYQTQTSTGNSTTSTGNSTGNGTPDHQSTDLDYESQFIFPNGFVDQNGIYYVNSFEPYPLMVYNAPYYPPEFIAKAKRCSISSLTESTSPNNEETTSQDLNELSDYNNGATSLVYPAGGFYFNCVQQQQPHQQQQQQQQQQESQLQDQEQVDDTIAEPRMKRKKRRKKQNLDNGEEKKVGEEEEISDYTDNEDEDDDADKENVNKDKKTEQETKQTQLKADAEEFIPRAYRQPEIIPIVLPSHPIIPIEINAFIPQIPLNFVQPIVNFNNTQPNEPTTTTTTTIATIPAITTNSKTNTETQTQPQPQIHPQPQQPKPKSAVDIAQIVSKLEEEAAKAKQQQPKAKEEKRNPIKRYYNNNNNNNINKPKQSPKKCERFERLHEKKIVPKVPNQWIAVSRKKRKNRIEEIQQIDEPSLEEITAKAEQIEISVISKTEDIENKKEEQEIKIEELKVEKKKIEVLEVKPVKSNHENKTKKKKKAPLKRVIIKDQFQIEETVKIEEPSKIEVVKLEPALKTERAVIVEEKIEAQIKDVVLPPVEPSIKSEESIVEEPAPQTPEQSIESINKIEETKTEEKIERKTKNKKKKKTNKLSTSAILGADDSYDFLLERTLDESEKTNIEISQELDKMIQRGMYNNLEEKIKTLHNEPDEFFKTLINNMSSRESSVEKSIFKNPIITSSVTSPLLKPLNLVEDFTKTKEVFLDKTIKKTDNDNKEKKYPITEAVKEWMTKTRETTPEVEILKSPSEIFKEFHDSPIAEAEEDEELIFTQQQQEDEYWEDEIKIKEEEEIGIYRKNEDYLKMKEEYDDGRKYPKHGNLPYRAICCSIM